MIDVVVDQGSLGLADSFFDGMKLLGEIETRSPLVKHHDHPTKVTLGPLQPIDDFRMGFMKMVVCHAQGISPPGGYGNGSGYRNVF